MNQTNLLIFPLEKTIKRSLIGLSLLWGLSILSCNPKVVIINPEKGQAIFNEYYIATEDGASNLYVNELGQGEPVIVLHGGFGNDHTNVIKVARGLENDKRFIFYDQRGSSLSYCERKFISIDNHVSDLETLRKRLKFEKFTMVSHSAGTLLAFHYLEQYPDRVNNLVMLGAMDPKNGNVEFFTEKERATWDIGKSQKDQFHRRPEIDQEIERAGLNISNKSPLQRQMFNQIKYYAAQNIYHIKKWKQLNLPHWNKIAAQATSESINWEYNFVDMLGSSKLPITVINGEYDLVVGAIDSPIWQSVVKNDATNVQLEIIKKAGHLAWIDDPKGFVKIFKRALNR